MTKTDELKHLIQASHALEAGQPIPLDAAGVVAEAVKAAIEHGTKKKRPRYLFKENGTGWLIGSPNGTVYLRTRQKGFQIIRFLLSNPGSQIHALQVAHCGALTPEQATETLTEMNVERARKNISAQVKTAIKKLDHECPEIAAHLRRHLSTGIYCCYAADPNTIPEWDLISI